MGLLLRKVNFEGFVVRDSCLKTGDDLLLLAELNGVVLVQ
jgi:hypothetical protein